MSSSIFAVHAAQPDGWYTSSMNNVFRAGQICWMTRVSLSVQITDSPVMLSLSLLTSFVISLSWRRNDERESCFCKWAIYNRALDVLASGRVTRCLRYGAFILLKCERWEMMSIYFVDGQILSKTYTHTGEYLACCCCCCPLATNPIWFVHGVQ